MGKLLGLDVGSSSVIAGILSGTKVLKEAPRAFFRSKCIGRKVEVDPRDLLRAVAQAISALGEEAKGVDAVSLAVMCPAWVIMDKDGTALTPIVTHQDRRSVAEAKDLETRVGKRSHLDLVGCRPFPGGISSTTWAWYQKYEPQRLKRADLFGHLNTFLHRQMTGSRVMDPSNASFTGLYETLKLGGWSSKLCSAAGVPKGILPEILDGDRIAGRISPAAGRRFGLRSGTPMMTGIVDGSAGMLLAGAQNGRLFNVCGSTDVLALCTGSPKPHEALLTRALGIGSVWLQVGTLAAVGSALYWARERLYPEMSKSEFVSEMFRLSKLGHKASGGVTFSPYMAGERTSIEQRQAAFDGLTLSTTRENMLSAMIEALIGASAARLPLLRSRGTEILSQVVVSGGSDGLDRLMRRDWPRGWKFRSVTDATMRGLGLMVPKE